LTFSLLVTLYIAISLPFNTFIVKSPCGLILLDNDDREGEIDGEDVEIDLIDENTDEDTADDIGEDTAECIGENVGVDFVDDIILFSTL
jgi:hypothetical protein